jgi:CheY-like chemotaxis protein
VGPTEIAASGPGVLLAEDDEVVRQMLAVALGYHGFRVWQAAGGREAVALYRGHGGSIGVVLLDVQMPDPDGPRTLALLRELDPAVPVVFVSGDTGRYTAEQLRSLGAAGVLQKPFDVADLVGLLRQVARPLPGG